MNVPHHHPHWGVYSTHAILEIDTPSVWKLLSDFNGLPKLLPGAVSSSIEGEGVGMVRTIQMDDGNVMQEMLIVMHPELFRLTYAMRDPSPYPWKHYFCTQQLQTLGGAETHFLCTGYYHLNGATDSEIKDLLREAYHGIFRSLARELHAEVAIQQS